MDYQYLPNTATPGAGLPVYALIFMVGCLGPALIMAFTKVWERQQQGRGLDLGWGGQGVVDLSMYGCFLLALRCFAIGFGYLVVVLVCVPVLCLHYIDKY
ncbi:hypothetical protein F4677DRAFT_447614 [Hypoxylon crocopeplum]|nr:hypothetical protein F4677DRAFT_447614 [Hypoxylon crocopeplum]